MRNAKNKKIYAVRRVRPCASQAQTVRLTGTNRVYGSLLTHMTVCPTGTTMHI